MYRLPKKLKFYLIYEKKNFELYLKNFIIGCVWIELIFAETEN